MKRAQSALEFVILVGAVLFFLILLLGAFQTNIGNKLSENKARELRDLVSQINDEIELASSASDGYSRYFTLPNKISGLNYNLYLEDNFIYANTSDGKFSIGIPTIDVNGSLIVGTNYIQKIEGRVYLNK